MMDKANDQGRHDGPREAVHDPERSRHGDGGNKSTPYGTAHSLHAISTLPRRVPVKGRGGVAATVIVTAVQGQVWMSIEPPFTWEAIMEPRKVDEVIQMLGLTREDAQRMMSRRSPA
jgi:hypothetical protein